MHFHALLLYLVNDDNNSYKAKILSRHMNEKQKKEQWTKGSSRSPNLLKQVPCAEDVSYRWIHALIVNYFSQYTIYCHTLY